MADAKRLHETEFIAAAPKGEAMFVEWIGAERRGPLFTGERTTCSLCKSELIAVRPTDARAHWRHRGEDCDPWSEPEGEWHLGWKDHFPLMSREVPMIDAESGEKHRADVFHLDGGRGTTVELQHSSISEKERDRREVFYLARGEMFWLVHIHDETASTAWSFKLSLTWNRPVEHKGRQFFIMSWGGRGSRFIEKWKRSRAHVFFDLDGFIFYLATFKACSAINEKLGKREFALIQLKATELITAVVGSKPA